MFTFFFPPKNHDSNQAAYHWQSKL